MTFGAEATVGDTYVDCLGASADEIDCDTLSNIGKENQSEAVEPIVTPVDTDEATNS